MTNWLEFNEQKESWAVLGPYLFKCGYARFCLNCIMCKHMMWKDNKVIKQIKQIYDPGCRGYKKEEVVVLIPNGSFVLSDCVLCV